MRITLIGSGNVATHLGAAFKNAGHRIVQVYSRDPQHAALLAYHLGAEATNELHTISSDTDLFVISVKDDAITTVAAALPAGKAVVHTSGAVNLQDLLAVTPNAGVFYPLQTFSKTKELNFGNVPLCLEGANEEILAQLEELARNVSSKVYRVDSAQRKVLHLSAVFACNFPNHLYRIAQQLLGEHDMSFDMLRPLIMETADKVQQHLPADVQTGPAIRNDDLTMAAHLQMLEGKDALQQMYRLISQDIIKNGRPTNSDR